MQTSGVPLSPQSGHFHQPPRPQTMPLTRAASLADHPASSSCSVLSRPRWGHLVHAAPPANSVTPVHVNRVVRPIRRVLNLITEFFISENSTGFFFRPSLPFFQVSWFCMCFQARLFWKHSSSVVCGEDAGIRIPGSSSRCGECSPMQRYF